MDPRSQLIEDLYKRARAADKIDKERAETFQGLVQHPGWKLFVELLDFQVGSLGEAVLAPSGSMDGALGLEYIKGTMRGLLLARHLPQYTIDQMKPPVPANGEAK